jgi:DMSO/TMAO reductase YedYZ molybdopterin-dependent catalytic subunit
MTKIKRFPSLFRPRGGVDQSVLEQNKGLVDQISRRGLFRGTMSVGALTMLTGCDWGDGGSVEQALRAVSRWNDVVQGAIFRPNHLAPTFSAAEVLKPPRFNAHYEIEDVKPVDGRTWKLEVSGLVNDKHSWSLAEMMSLPQQEMIIRHICVEGWDYVGQWSGVNLRQFLERVGADLRARYIAFRCADGYTEALDMATALHPQTILATKYAGEPLPDPFGFPLRLRTSTKLGFKNPKWLTAMEVTNTRPGTFFGDQGFNWFSGI